MAVAFTITVDSRDWSEELTGWHCSALAIPGGEVDAVYVQDGRVDKAWYEVPEGLSMIRWVHGTPPPSKATLALKLTKELSTQELTSRWRKLAIVLPFTASLLVGLISAIVPIPARTSMTSVWTLKGAVQNTGEFQAHEVQTFVMPPDLRLKPDFTFEGQLPIATREDGSLAFPNVILMLKDKAGFDVPVVHLVNPGQKLPASATEYSLDVDPTHHVIDIRTPIRFRRGAGDPPFAPRQTAVPVVAQQ
jgi:hypothetical protein